MHAGIQQQAAAQVAPAPCMPRRRRCRPVPGQAGHGVVQGTQGVGLDQPLEGEACRLRPLLMHRAQQYPPPRAQLHNPPRRRGVERQGLLDEHMPASLRRLLGQVHMRRRRRADRDHFDLRVAQQVPHLRVHRHLQPCLDALARRGVGIGHRHQVGAGQGQQLPGMP